MIALTLLAALNKKFGLELSENVLMTLAGVIGAYVLSRGWAKRGSDGQVWKKGETIGLMLAAMMLASGCAYQHTASVNPATRQVETFTQVVWFQKANVEGLKAHSKTKAGTSTAFSVSKEQTETQTEALAVIAEAVAKGVVEGAKK